ncbi:TetR/AcrR family transcriptional repressor of nem operon [Catenulispora sp. GP43]|uniref:TetR/AcrR family transcriptional regulator n=1 Tax=Catenulispora sp. GP43 TaxID=3156263 RepID=UPI00351551ED
MGRVSQAQAQENRAKVVAAAARLLRERGTDVSVADMMKAAGLTHGGFYKQFESKEALVAEATALAFANQEQLRARTETAHDGDHDEARRSLTDWYLSTEHRDTPGEGCPTAALAVDMARGEDDSAARRVYADGVRDFAAWIAVEGEDDGLVRLSTMVGALLLARSTEGTELSERFLDAAREAIG